MSPEQLFDDISQFVSDSRALLQQGSMMELSGLENQVLVLCKEIVGLSQEQRVQYADQLQQLMADLTALGEEITVQRDQVGEELRKLPSHQKAHAAYRTTGTVVKEDKDDEG